MEAQILHYYLKIFNIFILLITIFFTLITYNIFFKKFIINQENIIIQKNESFDSILNGNFNNLKNYERLFLKAFYKIYILKDKRIHYGEFIINSKTSFYDFLKIITSASNLVRKLTIIEGSTKYDLNDKIVKLYNISKFIPYDEILADTYFINSSENLDELIIKLKKFKKNYFNSKRNNNLFSKYTDKEIIIIGSLIEKEGIDYEDKKKIFSVINNRIDKNMKLQIDATVIYALTNGSYNLDRKLTYNDLKFNHPANTYVRKGLPPNPISYVGTKTIELMLENYNTDYFFYFFDENKKKHIFTKNFSEHKKKLDEYRRSK